MHAANHKNKTFNDARNFNDLTDPKKAVKIGIHTETHPRVAYLKK